MLRGNLSRALTFYKMYDIPIRKPRFIATTVINCIYSCLQFPRISSRSPCATFLSGDRKYVGLHEDLLLAYGDDPARLTGIKTRRASRISAPSTRLFRLSRGYIASGAISGQLKVCSGDIYVGTNWPLRRGTT